jgi:hypothetical protein
VALPRRQGRVGSCAVWSTGGQQRFSDLAIETALTLRLVFHLPLRQTEGFVQSILAVMRAGLDAPDHTTLSRRSQFLDVATHDLPATGPYCAPGHSARRRASCRKAAKGRLYLALSGRRPGTRPTHGLAPHRHESRCPAIDGACVGVRCT